MDFAKAVAQGADVIAMGVQACPFLRSIAKDTDLNLVKGFGALSAGVDGKGQAHCPAQRGPIFCDEPSFESTFRLFHGAAGVIPLKKYEEKTEDKSKTCPREEAMDGPPKGTSAQHPLAARAATISMSAFGGGAPNPFSWDGFMAARNKQKQPEAARSNRPEPLQSSKHSEASVGGKDFASQPEIAKSRGELGKGPRAQQAKSRAKPAGAAATAEASTTKHHTFGEPVDAQQWLSTSDCPIAKMHRVLAELAPAATELFRHPTKGLKLTCPAPIIAARAALAKTPPVRQLRPQSLPTKLLAVGGSTLLVNVPFGAWREHVEKFSPEWFVAVHVTVPFVAMLRKAVLMPKHAMVFTILAAILGQVIGSRGERYRLQQRANVVQQAEGQTQGGVQSLAGVTAKHRSPGFQESRARAMEKGSGLESVGADEAASQKAVPSALGVLDLFSGKAEEMGWTAGRVKGRVDSRKPCGSSWKLPGVPGLGLPQGRTVSVH